MRGYKIYHNKDRCYKKVSGTKHSYEKNGRWVSVVPLGKKKGFVVDTIKDGDITILGKSMSKLEANKIAKKYMVETC